MDIKGDEDRIVITGLGIIAPNGVGKENFLSALKAGRSGIRKIELLEKLGFRCTVGGQPDLPKEVLDQYLTALEQKRIVADGVRFGVLSGLMAWEDAGLEQSDKDEVLWESGVIMGAGMSGGDVFGAGVPIVNEGKVKRLGSVTCPNTMSSSASAFLGGLIGCGNQVSTNASACASGTEAILLGAERIRLGLADRMVCGACDSGSEYVRAGFDAMRVLNSRSNNAPEAASRPLSSRAAGFVPSAGGGALVLERLSLAKARGARVYAELLGGAVNSGGQRLGGSMTAPNREAIRRVLRAALSDSQCSADSVDVISGHLTATRFDPYEIEAWADVLACGPEDFPYVQALKSLTGHALSAAGALEAVALTMQLHHGFLHPNANVDPIHSDVIKYISRDRIPIAYQQTPLLVGMSASFGFGDVNACLLLRKYIDTPVGDPII